MVKKKKMNIQAKKKKTTMNKFKNNLFYNKELITQLKTKINKYKIT
jgi:hypothetical protein